MLQKHFAEHPPSGAVRHRHLRHDQRIVSDRAVGTGNGFRARRGHSKCTYTYYACARVFGKPRFININAINYNQ